MSRSRQQEKVLFVAMQPAASHTCNGSVGSALELTWKGKSTAFRGRGRSSAMAEMTTRRANGEILGSKASSAVVDRQRQAIQARAPNSGDY